MILFFVLGDPGIIVNKRMVYIDLNFTASWYVWEHQIQDGSCRESFISVTVRGGVTGIEDDIWSDSLKKELSWKLLPTELIGK